MRRRSRSGLLALATTGILALSPLSAANLVVEQLELVTYGSLDEATGRFPVQSRLDFGLSIGGGEKFAGLLKLSYLSTKVESDLAGLKQTLSSTTLDASALARLNAPGLGLKTVAITAKRLFGLPAEATYFVGSLDTFCSGDEFVSLFGAAPFATGLRGPLRYPNGIKLNPTVSWDGVQGVYGTGFRFGYAPSDRSRIYLYAYQDADFDNPGSWSGDLRGLVDLGALKLEAFGGGSWDASHSLGLYRGGFLFYSAPGDIGEFYAQVGAPQWDPTKTFSINDIFFLFEPRVNFAGGGQLSLSVFYHPGVYREQPTGEGGSLDAGFNLRFGRLSTNGSQGGLESYLSFNPSSGDVTTDIAPYYEVIAYGVAWSFKLGIRPFPWPSAWYGIFRPFVGVKTSF